MNKYNSDSFLVNKLKPVFACGDVISNPQTCVKLIPFGGEKQFMEVSHWLVRDSNGTAGVSNGITRVSNGITGVSNGITGVSNGIAGVSNHTAGVSNGTAGVSNHLVELYEMDEQYFQLLTKYHQYQLINQ